MRYVQCLIQNKKYYQLRWLPEKFAHPENKLRIKGMWGESWTVKEVYKDWYERIEEAGKTIWYNEMSPYLEGDQLQDRLRQYKKMTKFEQVEEI